MLYEVITVLDEEHYGLEKVKERILEHLAVLKLNRITSYNVCYTKLLRIADLKQDLA